MVKGVNNDNWLTIGRWKLKKCGIQEKMKGTQNMAAVIRENKVGIENNAEDVYGDISEEMQQKGDANPRFDKFREEMDKRL